MIGAVEAYIKTIVGLLVMTAFTQIVVPDGSFKKYVGFVMGLLVTAAVISPVAEIVLGREFDFKAVFEKDFEFDEDYQKELAYDIYIEETEKEIELLSREKGAEVKNVKIKGDDGVLEKIEVEIEKPHGCVEAVRTFSGEDEKCEICKKTAEEVRKSIISLTGVKEASVNILGD